MEEKEKLRISVRKLVEFIFRAGDIDSSGDRLPSADAMKEGTRIHKQIQKSMGAGYQAEVPLSDIVSRPLYELTVEGRADGVFTANGIPGETETEDGQLELPIFQGMVTDFSENTVWIDEIKATYRNLEKMNAPVEVHVAQAKCYAYMYAAANGLDQIGVRMTYCHMQLQGRGGSVRGRIGRKRRYFHFLYSFEELEKWYQALMDEYGKWADFQVLWRRKRQASIKNLAFPYEYRDGQKKLAQDVYRTIARGKILFLQAPTGTGKTISTIYPAVKAVGEGLAERIFYLTAKTVTATVAKQTFQVLAQRGYRGKILQLTAKEKLCLGEETGVCDPVSCIFAKGHFDRVNDAVYELLTQKDVFTREEILGQAEKHKVCPYEMSLDLAEFSDAIICDYNYVFDPNVALKRFFGDGEASESAKAQKNAPDENIFLVDEAHNLVERSREMYSAWIIKEEFLEAKKLLKGKNPRIIRLLEKCNRQMLEHKRECTDYRILREGIGNLYFSVFQLVAELDEFLRLPDEFSGRKELLEFYFHLRNFLNIYDLVDEHYVIYARILDDERFGICLFCVDPSLNLQNRIDRGQSAVYFSATLLPIRYYKRLLSTRDDNYAVYAKSVFDPNRRLLLLGRGVSTRYKRRNPQEFQKIARYIYSTISCRNGNYMIFFPSYRLMEQVYEAFLQLPKEGECECLLQTPGMKEEDREDFLAQFEENRDHPFAAFCVMGGVFGEGIDLKNDRLIGCIVVGTGLPQISGEREILKNYYDRISGDGFDYAFRYPGMNKVLQAAGRVIRTTEDEGVILLLDDRFYEREYRGLFPREWENRRSCCLEDVEEKIRGFWESIGKGNKDEKL